MNFDKPLKNTMKGSMVKGIELQNMR